MILFIFLLLITAVGIDSLNRELKSTVRRSGKKQAIDPRKVPTDEVIQATFFTLTDPLAKVWYAIMATFGVRNHEAIKCDLSPLWRGESFIYVFEETKTGAREAWALYPEWIDRFNLRTPPPDFPIPLNADNRKLGGMVTKKLKGEGIPFDPYDLRHAWARRSIDFELDPRLSANSLGHSLEVHFKTYVRWITFQATQRAYARILQDPNRPQPPEISE
jgi:integrase